MDIYVMRHGTTVWNEKRILQGITKNRLSKNGIELVNNVAVQYKDVKFDVIISSPLMRTMQTSNIMNKYHNVKIIKNNDIIEIDQGVLTGKSKDNLTYEESLIKKARDKNFGLETYEEVYNRVKKFIDYIKTLKVYNCILIVTHSTVASMMDKILTNTKINIENDTDINYFKNAEIRKYSI